MKILLTGASGFLGRRVLARLESDGFETVVVGRKCPAGFLGEFIEVDLLEPGSGVGAIVRARATHLLHLAWYTEHGKYWTSPSNLRWIDATVSLVEAFCNNGGHHLVAAGTCAEYDWSSGYCREDATPLVPGTLYGVAKDATRRLVAAICASQSTYFSWGRIFLPYGPGEDRRRLIPSLFDVFQGRRAPFGVNSYAYRDFIHIDDIAQAFVTLIKAETNGSFNIATSEPTRISELVRLIATACNADPKAVLELAPTDRPGEPSLLVGENSRLKALGWHPEHRLGDITNRWEV